MKVTSKIILSFSLFWSVLTTICCILVVTISTWTMMHFEQYDNIVGLVIWQMVLNILILPSLLILLRKKLFPQSTKFYIAVKRIHIVVAVIYLATVFYEVNRYEHFIEFNKKAASFGPYKLPSGKQITPTNTFIDGDPKGRRMFLLQYQTELKLSDTLNLKDEIFNLSQQVTLDANKQEASFLAISAKEAPKNNEEFCTKGYTIIYAKDPLGEWKVLHKK